MNYFKVVFIYCMLLLHSPLLAQDPIAGQLSISENKTASSFPLSGNGTSISFYYDKSDAKVVQIAAEAFAQDLKAVTGKEIKLVSDASVNDDCVIIAGTIGHSLLIDQLVREKKINIDRVRGNWEVYGISIVNQPTLKIKKALVIAGSDRRGTAFGIFYLSRRMGVSPFVWWADIVPDKKSQLFVKGAYTSITPSVQYRGLFINDEDWGMQPWAAKNMDTSIKDIGPKTYAKVFELLLRLKANYIWPAMHPCTKAFYYYKENPEIADEYAIVVGGSHCEPMLRNNVFEWAENYENEYGKKPGEWSYDVNRDQIYTYWDDRIKEALHYESVFTVGMRGVHDGSMPGPNNPDEKMKLLEQVIVDQRKILSDNFKKPATGVPQIFVPYKEVLSLYRRGLPLADDITIIWPDDNHGYIRQLPDENERKRSGGHGVYYHLSYWGAPQDYLWLSSISPSLMAYEMNQAYRYGAKKLWVFNVGDIKPAEEELQFAMDMAWDISNASPEKAYQYTRSWAEEIFGKKSADAIAAIKNEYYLLAASGKPEHMNNVFFPVSETESRLKQYMALAERTQALARNIAKEKQNAYFELLMYPVMGAKLMNEKILFARKSFLPGATAVERTANGDKANDAFSGINMLTKVYNNTVANGKWNAMMSWHPRDQDVFTMPLVYDSASPAKKDSLQKIYSRLSSPQFILPASSFTAKQETGSTAIQLMPGLGIDGKGIMAFNTKGLPFSPTDPAYIEFDLPKMEAGRYSIVVKCLPTFDVDKSKNLRYAAAVNEEGPIAVNIHAEADSREWKENVIRGYSVGRTIHTLTGNKDKLKIYFRDYNLVINTIEFYKQ